MRLRAAGLTIKRNSGRLLLGALAALAILGEQPAAAGVLLSAHSGRVTFACRQGGRIAVDFDHGTVTDSISDTPVAADITADTIRWHSEFNGFQYDPHYGNQIVHHVADHMLDRRTGKLNGADACDTPQN